MKNQGNRKYWEKEAKRLFSLWIRQRDSIDGKVKCCTCDNTDYWRYMDCGHYESRGNMITHFDERNADVQCKICNNTPDGEKEKHRIYIDRKHGRGTSEELRILAKSSIKLSWSDLYDIANKFKIKLIENGFEIR